MNLSGEWMVQFGLARGQARENGLRPNGPTRPKPGGDGDFQCRDDSLRFQSRFTANSSI